MAPKRDTRIMRTGNSWPEWAIRRMCDTRLPSVYQERCCCPETVKRNVQRELSLQFEPLTPERWNDLETLFGERGACGGCWCMWWRLTRTEFQKRKGPRNKSSFKRIVQTGQVPGILAYAARQPVGWCAIQPREAYPVLERSRTLARVDEQPVWSVTCLFVAKPFRRSGVSFQLLRAAAKHARGDGAVVIEGYPIDPRKGTMPDAFVWTGLVSAFRRAGFEEVARRSATRPIMRLWVRRRQGRN